MGVVTRFFFGSGMVLLLVAGFAGFSGGQDAVGTQQAQPIASFPYCGAYKNCALNNSPSGYCRYSNNYQYYICSTVTFASTCTDGNSNWGNTCYGVDLSGATCTVYYYSCTS